MGAQAADGRVRILRAALDLFGDQGYELTSMAQIASRAGVAKSLLHYHFAGKSALLHELLAPYLDAVEQTVDELEAATSDPSAVLARYLDLVIAHPREVALLNADVTARSEGLPGARYADLQRRWRALLGVDEVMAAAALGVLTRPAVQLEGADLEGHRSALLAAAAGVLTTGRGEQEMQA